MVANDSYKGFPLGGAWRLRILDNYLEIEKLL